MPKTVTIQNWLVYLHFRVFREELRGVFFDEVYFVFQAASLNVPEDISMKNPPNLFDPRNSPY